MTAREQYKYAQWVMRLWGVNTMAGIIHDGYLGYLWRYRADILLKAWQSL